MLKNTDFGYDYYMISNYFSKLARTNKEKIMYELKKVEVPSGESIAYREAGSGDLNILLIHGNQSSSTIYHDFMKRYESRAKVFAIDLAGFGESSYNNKHEQIIDWAKDVNGFMEAVGIEKVVVVGHSAGGGVGMKLAAAFPDKVSHLLLIGSVGVKGFYLPKLDKLLRPVPNEFVYSYEEVANHPSIKFVEKLIQSRAKLSTWNMWKQSLYNINKPAKSVYETYIEEFFKERCFTDISVALCQFNITDEVTYQKGDGSIKDIKAPVTWFHGKKDKVVPFAIAENSIKYFPYEADLIAINQAGHMVFNDTPNEFYSHVDRILAQYI